MSWLCWGLPLSEPQFPLCKMKRVIKMIHGSGVCYCRAGWGWWWSFPVTIHVISDLPTWDKEGTARCEPWEPVPPPQDPSTQAPPASHLGLVATQAEGEAGQDCPWLEASLKGY